MKQQKYITVRITKRSKKVALMPTYANGLID